MRLQAKQGRVLFGVDMRIVGDDGGDLPWDGSSFGDLLVRGPWVLREYYKERGSGAGPLVTDADGRAWFRPATWRPSIRTATCTSPTAART
jgi:3-(methylthio)propionyl---CoA ligase